jgi:hypothetical protein
MSKVRNIHTKPAQQAAAAATAAKAGSCPPARKAVVLGQVKAGSGKMYQVLAPTLAPQHLSLHDIELAIEMMVAAR